MEAENTLGHARPSTDHERRGMADGGACVPEVLTGVVTEPLEPLCGSVSPATVPILETSKMHKPFQGLS